MSDFVIKRGRDALKNVASADVKERNSMTYSETTRKFEIHRKRAVAEKMKR